VRVNRRHLDKNVRNTQIEERKLQPGALKYSSRGSLCFASRFHKRTVYTLSNAYDPVGDDFVETWFPAKRGEKPETVNGKLRKSVPIPPVVKNYRHNMGGVDTFDQLRAYVLLEMRSMKFWHPMMYFIIESALVNSWILYKQNRELAGLPLKFTNVEFRESIALALAAEWEDSGCTNYQGCTSPSVSLAVKKQHKSRRSLAMDVSDGDRFYSDDRHVTFLEPIPLLEASSQKRKRRQMLCGYCNTHRTSQWCRKCAVALCSTQCYVWFHTKSMYENHGEN
jgi:hypothetical protein